MAEIYHNPATLPLTDAAEGDFSRLASRLSRGEATREEQAVAADIIMGKLKASNHPPRDWDKIEDKLERDLAICRFIGRWCKPLAKVPPKKAVVAAVLDHKPSFKVGRTTR